MTRNRTVLVVGLLVALLLAGVASWYASSAPDGLERVAADHGLAAGAEEHELAGSPLADYDTEGVANERLSGGLAGVAGVGVTLLIGGGLFTLIRRRTDVDRDTTSTPAGTSAP
jgi:hypothetical protein